ncbi:hypothetical protein A989_06203 [Xanthomonas translucens DAR61454]|nr:hypothetical protein NZ30_14265 [Xanthomonas translucens pv. undulosa]ELQ12939.1 hypothetical protein A989_06203 [Xanthomonas translucens DAR61454]
MAPPELAAAMQRSRPLNLSGTGMPDLFSGGMPGIAILDFSQCVARGQSERMQSTISSPLSLTALGA